jgi:hypothetical protein
MTDARVSDIHAPKALTDLPIVAKNARERVVVPLQSESGRSPAKAD